MAKKTYRVHLCYTRTIVADVKADDMTGADAEAMKLEEHLNETPGDGLWEVVNLYEVADAE